MNSADLVARLRDADTHSQQRVMGGRIFGEAADRIEALEAWKAEALEVLRPLSKLADGKANLLANAARRLVEKEDGR